LAKCQEPFVSKIATLEKRFLDERFLTFGLSRGHKTQA